MGGVRRFLRLWEPLLSIGSYPGEPAPQRGKRRIMVGVLVVSLPLVLLAALSDLEAQPWVAAVSLLTSGYIILALGILPKKPHWFAGVIGVVFVLAMLDGLVETVLLGGLRESSATIAFALLAVLGALVAFSVRTALY